MKPGPTQIAYVGLGANLGNARETLRQALADLDRLPSTRLLRASSLYRSAPVDAQGPDFWNAVASVETQLAPDELLAALQTLELAAGRERPYRNAPRTLDLDLLLHGTVRQGDPALTLPHPRMRERAFVLLPLSEIAPDLVDAGDLARVADQRIQRLT
ncbi:2-amino-4-hydroxy-6-hydroxymethyldihydropteridine diphosphokinase [Leptospira sp. 96542]|nr:2-amino-4-hydroxy-6-hydroxymethyldihydropteridine diphosphokinase [Leptospira sp. 96542]